MPRPRSKDKNRAIQYFKLWLLKKSLLIAQIRLFSLSSYCCLLPQCSSTPQWFISPSFLRSLAFILVGTYSVPVTEDTVMLETRPSWSLDGVWWGHRQRHTVNACTNRPGRWCHEEKYSRVKALWVLHWKGTQNGKSGRTPMTRMVKLAMHSRPLHFLVSCFPLSSLLREGERLGRRQLELVYPDSPTVWQSKT